MVASHGCQHAEASIFDSIALPGLREIGKHIAAAAANNLTRLHLELGGKSAAIVLDDADLDAAAPGLASPSFFQAGQACAATTRCLVPAAMYDAAMEKMVGFVQKLKVGDPADPAVLVGPLIREARRTAVEEYIRIGQEEGATLATGGSRPGLRCPLENGQALALRVTDSPPRRR